MYWRLAKAVLVLPGSVLVYIPLLIHWLSGHWPFGPADVEMSRWLMAGVIAVPSLLMAGNTMKLFTGEGEGTPAPWDPPRKFVVSGPYRHVRNPMIVSVIGLILAEALVLNSAPLAVWALVFFLGNTVYFKYVEEPGLQRRFGGDYTRYMAAVPRWIPRISPYDPPDKASE